MGTWTPLSLKQM